MVFTVEIPDNSKNVNIEVLCDGKRYYCNSDRYRPGYWNGINGGQYYCQYFDMEDENRVREMTEIASVLIAYGIDYKLSKLKKQYRIMVDKDNYKQMDLLAKEAILNINIRHNRL